jgi:hypothetical protein
MADSGAYGIVAAKAINTTAIEINKDNWILAIFQPPDCVNLLFIILQR